MTGLYYGFWDYWELRHKVTFDGPNRLILINEGVTSLDVQTDIYSDWKEWVQLEDNLKYLIPLNTVGGQPTVTGQRLDVTYFLINDWKIKPFSGTYNLDIIGNIFDISGSDIKIPANVIANEPNNITVNLNTSVIVRQLSTSNSGSGLTVAENETLYRIDDNVIAIQTLLQSPITASLEPTQLIQLTNIETLSVSQSLQLISLTETNISQSLQLTDLQDKLFEVWQLHGLDISEPLTVNQTSRAFGAVAQTISTTGTGSLQETIITRL